MDLNRLQSVMLDAAREQSLDARLGSIVRGLAETADAALVRIWLMGPGDICETCPMRGECTDQRRCLHLAASAGTPLADQSDWSRLNGRFRRFPLGIRKIGVIGASGSAQLLNCAQEPAWIADTDWVANEKICAFAGQPLVFKNEILGVLGLFSRAPLEEQQVTWLHLFADHAAAAIANARAYEKIESLQARLQLENRYLRQEVDAARDFGEIIGTSAALRKTMQQVELVAATNANVLIEGESGVGKELIARAIHESSRRRDRVMVRVNCASIPKDLFESEFFGHVKGSFTGAVSNRVGRFQLAHGGTLFLDEVGEIPIDLQSKLLRVLQEGEFERVGDTKQHKSDARIISATNRDLYREIENGDFREDLYYRLSAFPIEVPPLRRRREDIPALAAHFLGSTCRRLGVPLVHLTTQHLEQLSQHDWPGNVRELQHVIERGVIMAQGGRLELDIGRPPAKRRSRTRATASETSVLSATELKQQERESVIAALKQSGGKIYGPGGAAELLGLKPTTLASRLKSLGIEKNRFRGGSTPSQE